VTQTEEAIYRFALKVLPAAVEREFGADMAQMFRDRRRQVRGRPVAILRLWTASLWDIALQAVRIREAGPVVHWHGWTAAPYSSSATNGRLAAFLGSVLQDIRVGVRMLARDRAFTVVAVLVLAIGIGANSAAFSLVNALVFKATPGHPAGAVVGLYNRDTAHPGGFRAFSYPEFQDLRAPSAVFAAVTAHNFAFVGVSEGDRSHQVIVDMVSREFFDVFGAPLLFGRTFTAEEERPGTDGAVAILSYASWQKRGGAPTVLGSIVHVNGRAHTVIGVAQKNFGGSLALLTPELWVPISDYDRLANDFVREGTTTGLADRRTRMLIVDVQLQPGLTIEKASPALQAMTARLVAADSAAPHSELLLAPLSRMGVTTSPQTDSVLTTLTAALLSLSGIVLLIASLNLANMLLARGVARRKEFAIRLAIGGSRARVVRQLLTEGLVLAVVGASLGLLAAEWWTSMLASKLAPYIPVSLTLDPTPDLRVVTATLTFGVISALLFSLGPAWALSRTQAVPELKSQSGELTGRTRLGSRHLLVGGQLALSLVMLTAAGLFVETSLGAATANPGFSMDRGLIAQVDLSVLGRTQAQTTPVYQHVLETLRTRSDVVAAGLTSSFPFTGFSDQRPVRLTGALRDDQHSFPAELVSTDSDYFRAVGLPLLRGRTFGTDALVTSRFEAIIDVPLARHLFGSENPIGQTIEYDPTATTHTTLTVVGLVSGVGGADGRDADTTEHLYQPYGRDPRTGVYVLIRTSAPTAQAEVALIPDFRRTFLAAETDLPLMSLETLAMYRDRGVILAVERTAARIFGVFGAAALLLAGIGVYGLKAYVVSRRTREIGIRLALGATPQSVLWLVTKEGLAVAVGAVAAGAALSVLAAVQLRAALLPEDQPYALLLVGALATLLTTSVCAGILPARRATRIQPVEALRTN
jgi:predicted permease